MNREELAKKLVAAPKAAERKRLLRENPGRADVLLARVLKEICYAAWTHEPTRAQQTARAVKSLYAFNRSKQIRAYVFWLTGIADLTRGKLESTIRNLDQAAGVFRMLENEHEAANTQVAKIYALALLGKYREAVGCGRETLKIFEKYGDELAAGKIEKNLGNIVARQDDNRQAEEFYLAARRRFRKVGDIRELAMSENSLANTYAELNDFLRAEKFYRQALKRARQADMLVTVAEIEASMGNLATFRGKFDEALRLLEHSRRKYVELKMPHQTVIADLEIADIYLELNLAREAFAIYQRVAGELSQLKLQGEEARARANLGKAAVLLGETGTARTQLKKSARLYLVEKNKTGAAAVKLNEARLELSLKNYRRVLSLADEAQRLLQSSENVRFRLSAEWFRSEALRNLGEFKKAEKNLPEILREAMRREQPNIMRAALNSLGLLALERGDRQKAKKYFKRAVKQIEQMRAPLPAEEFRMAFLADKLAPFENLAKIYLAEKDWKRAFFYVEKARSRSLAENLEDDLPDGKKTRVPKKLTEKLRELREELNWFYSRLNRAAESEIAALQTQAGKLEKSITEVLRQIESTGTARVFSPATRSGPDPAALKDLQRRLGARQALIEFVNLEGVAAAFVITGEKIEFISGLAPLSEIREFLEGLHFQFGALRFGAGNLEKFMPELKHRADAYLRKLYDALLGPLESLTGGRDLVLVPFGVLHYVPFHALFDGKKYVVETRRINYSPSAAIWQKLTARPAKTPHSALLFGFADERIPLVEGEIKALEKVFEKSKSFTGRRASFAAFIRNAEKFDCLHLACHGQFRPENPMFSSLQLADGFVTVRDICDRKLRAELVTLSACETGLNQIFDGDEIIGLARGFLTAGAGSLVLSLWTVNDASTADLMKDFYAGIIEGKAPSEALKIAQSNFIKRGCHPYFWSPFAIIGR